MKEDISKLIKTLTVGCTKNTEENKQAIRKVSNQEQRLEYKAEEIITMKDVVKHNNNVEYTKNKKREHRHAQRAHEFDIIETGQSFAPRLLSSCLRFGRLTQIRQCLCTPKH